MHHINTLDNFIGAYYIDESICDQLIALHEDNKEKHPGEIKQGTVDVSVKKSEDSKYLWNDYKITTYFDELLKCAHKYIDKYPWCNEYGSWFITDTINIQKYKPGEGFYGWHAERVNDQLPNSTRHLVFITYLNDVHDGGETEFFHQNIKVKPERGLTLIFPVDWTFTHRGIPAPNEEKYIATGWFNYLTI